MKINIGCVFQVKDEKGEAQQKSMDIRGRSLVSGLPKTISVSSDEMFEAFEEPSASIVDAVKSVLEQTPPELVGDISTNGIVMTGGGSLVSGLDKLIERETGIRCYIADDAVSCVAIGTGKTLDNIDILPEGNSMDKYRRM